MTQRIVASFFAGFLWLVAFGAMTSYGEYAGWIGLTALVAGMLMILWAIRPKPKV